MADGFDPDAYLKKKSTSQGFDPDAYLASKSKPKKSNFEKVTQAFDSVTGAPSRAAVSKLLEGDVMGAGSAFAENFAGDSTKAPTAKDLALKIGVNDNKAELEKAVNDPLSLKGLATRTIGQMIGGAGLADLVTRQGAKFLDKQGVTNADIAALPIDMATDWTNLVPALGLLKKGSKGANALNKVDDVAKAASKVDEAVNVVKKTDKAIDGLKASDAIVLANEAGEKINSKAIKEASQRLGFKPSTGMLTENKVIRGLESSLEQSPSIAGSLVRSETDKVRKGLNKAAESLTSNTTAFTKFELGDKIKTGIIEKIAQRHAPLAEQFNKLRESTAFIEVPEKSKLTLAQNFMKHPDVALAPNSSWGSKAQQFGDYLLNTKTADDVKRLRTIVGKEIQASTNPNEQRVLNSIYGSLSRLEENTIKRAAIATARNSKEGLQIGKQMLGELKSAKQGYKGLMTDISDVAQAGSLKKSRSIEDFLDLIDNVPSEQIGDKLFKTNDLKALSVIEKQFPSEFSLMRQQKINEIVEKSLSKGQIDAMKLTKAVKGMGPEVIKKIFGGNSDVVLKDIQTVLDSMPNMMGPSGTPQGQMFLDMVNLPFQGKEMLRFGAYKKLKNPIVPIDEVVKRTIPFKKAGQVYSQALPDLLGVAKSAQLGVGSSRGLSDLIKERKK